MKRKKAKNEGEQLQLAGLEQAVAKHGPEMGRALLCAELLAMHGDEITTDHVRSKFSEIYGYDLNVGNALGALFKTDAWEFVRRVQSTRKEAHGRYICSWRLKRAFLSRGPNQQPFDVGVANGERICAKCGVNVEGSAEHSCESRIQ
jgi:hypothetical protein